MQTKIAFAFVLHVIVVGFLLARGEWRLRTWMLVGLFLYFFAFYWVAGYLLQMNSGLYVLELSPNPS